MLKTKLQRSISVELLLLGSLPSLCCLLSSMYILSSSYARKAETPLHFHSRLSPLAVLFGQWDPGHQALPSNLCFLEGQEVLGAQPFPDCPGLLWFRHVHHAQVPQEIPACHASQENHLSLVVRHNTVKETVMETKI